MKLPILATLAFFSITTIQNNAFAAFGGCCIQTSDKFCHNQASGEGHCKKGTYNEGSCADYDMENQPNPVGAGNPLKPFKPKVKPGKR